MQFRDGCIRYIPTCGHRDLHRVLLLVDGSRTNSRCACISCNEIEVPIWLVSLALEIDVTRAGVASLTRWRLEIGGARKSRASKQTVKISI